jgi:hypothetical protein
MCYDVARDVLVLFGGFSAPIGAALPDDLWELDLKEPEKGWVQRFIPGTVPVPRSDCGLVYDTLLERVVLHGGADNSFNLLNDTWSYDGSTWTLLEADGAVGAPTRRFIVEMAYDKARDRVVLFGGISSDFLNELNDTWEFNGTSWAEITPATTTPSTRTFHTVAYDDTRQKVYVWGGDDDPSSFVPLNDLHEWDGTDYTLIDSAIKPPARRVGQSAYHPRLRGIFVNGGNDLTSGFNDAWLNDTDGWRPMYPPTVPDATTVNAPCSRHDIDGSVIFVGGQEGVVSPFLEQDKTWRFSLQEEWDRPDIGFDFNTDEIEVEDGARLRDPTTVASSLIRYMPGVPAESLSGYVMTADIPANTRVLHALELDGVAMYWDGSAWASSDLSESQMTDGDANIDDNLSTLTIATGGQIVRPVLLLISDNDADTPDVKQVATTYDYAQIITDTPRECLVKGVVIDMLGDAVSGATVKAKAPFNGFFNSGHFIHGVVAETTTGTDGKWSLSLVETETVQETLDFEISFVDRKIAVLSKFDNKTIPDQAEVEFSSL